MKKIAIVVLSYSAIGVILTKQVTAVQDSQSWRCLLAKAGKPNLNGSS